MTTVRCKVCREEIPLDEAYHRHSHGLRCPKCHRGSPGGQYALAGIALWVLLLIGILDFTTAPPDLRERQLQLHHQHGDDRSRCRGRSREA
jgi:hypothetical protein